MEIDKKDIEEIIERLDIEEPAAIARRLKMLILDKPLPCPCCGKEPVMDEEVEGQIQIRCPECGLMSRVDIPEEAVSAWNRRGTE
jgi:hypothetical protein